MRKSLRILSSHLNFSLSLRSLHQFESSLPFSLSRIVCSRPSHLSSVWFSLSSPTPAPAPTPPSSMSLSESDYKSKLSQEEYAVLRLAHTERAFSSPLYKEKSEGTYKCKACEQPLYNWKTKFDSGCGWPAFYEPIPGAVTEKTDDDGRRTEVLCKKCNSHLGHVFKGEKFNNPTDLRYCINGVCLTLDKTAK